MTFNNKLWVDFILLTCVHTSKQTPNSSHLQYRLAFQQLELFLLQFDTHS